MAQAAQTFLSDFEGFLDTILTSNRKIDLEKVMPQYKLKPVDVDAIRAKLQNRADELELVVLDADESLMEGWSNVPKAKQKEMLELYYQALEFFVKRKSHKPAKKSVDGVFKSYTNDNKKSKEDNTTPRAGKLLVAMLPKYRMLQVYENAVKDGDKIEFDNAYGVQLKTVDEMTSIKEMTSAEVLKFVSDKTPIKNKPSTRVSKFATEFVVF